MLWMRLREDAQAATFSSVISWSWLSSSVTLVPSLNVAPAREAWVDYPLDAGALVFVERAVVPSGRVEAVRAAA